MDPTRILGVDPGLNITGYGVLDTTPHRFQLHEAGVVRGGTGAELAKRVQSIYQGICEILVACRPQILALEELYSHYQRPQTAILMGHARGVICLAAANHAVPVVGYSATQVKRILTGSGRAPKNQVQQAIRRELRLAELPQPPDVADALAIAICHYYLSQSRGRAMATPANRPAPERGKQQESERRA
jgi:crossover junction endodeoxyribonuclease RuvC